MRNRLLSICLAAFLIILPLSVFAETGKGFADVKVDYVRENGTVTISGKAEFVANIDEPVRLMVLKPDPVGEDAVSNLDALINGDVDLEDVCIHIDETLLSSDKTFSFTTFTLAETLDAGDYVIRLAAEQTEYTQNLSVATPSQVLDMISKADSADEVLDCIEKYNDVYKLDIAEKSEYAKLTEAGKKYVLENIASEDYETVEELKEIFNTYLQLYRIYLGPWGVMEDIIEKHDSLLNISSYMDDYNKLSQSEKDKVYKAVSGELYEGTEDFADAFKDALENADEKESSDGKTPSKNNGGGAGKVSASVTTPVAPEKSDETEKEDNVGKEPFNDLENYSWAKESILKLYDNGIVNGKGDKIFAPGDYVTRAEAVKMIMIAFGLTDDSAECDFSDVDENSWMYPYIAAATKYGIVLGYEDGTFGAENKITREDFATIIMRAVNVKSITLDEKEEVIDFADGDEIAAYAVEAVQNLQKSDIINGAGENMFLPKNSTTRAETAKIIAAFVS